MHELGAVDTPEPLRRIVAKLNVTPRRGPPLRCENDEYMQRRRRPAPALQRLGIGDPFPWRGLWVRQEGATSEEPHAPPGQSPGRTRLVPHHRAGSRRLGLRPRFGWRMGRGSGLESGSGIGIASYDSSNIQRTILL